MSVSLLRIHTYVQYYQILLGIISFVKVSPRGAVSLPREWFQEIKRMITVHSTHGLFLTCTQGSCLYLHVHSN
jgi:hypothetical protein